LSVDCPCMELSPVKSGMNYSFPVHFYRETQTERNIINHTIN
jgi:hypothetical protein